MNALPLGPLSSDPAIDGALKGVIPFGDGAAVDLRIDSQSGQPDDAIARATQVADTLAALNARALGQAADALLDDYNTDWRCYSETAPDGTTVPFENPVLTAAQFQARLSLTSVTVTDGTLEFCYTDGGLFGGHSIFVISFDGVQLTDTSVELFG